MPKTAIISVYDKTGLLDLAKGLIKQNVRLLASGGTAKMIRESGFAVEYVPITPLLHAYYLIYKLEMSLPLPMPQRCSLVA